MLSRHHFYNFRLLRGGRSGTMMPDNVTQQVSDAAD
jgi:hypothetical protein